MEMVKKDASIGAFFVIIEDFLQIAAFFSVICENRVWMELQAAANIVGGTSQGLVSSSIITKYEIFLANTI